MRRLLLIAVIALALGGAVAWKVTAPKALDAAAVAGLTGDPVHGEQVFWAGGCASCHIAPDAAETDRPVLSGGQRLASPFGTFVVPNISPDPEHGIGGWSLLEFANALTQGVSPEGEHYFPAFPYAAYQHASLQDVADMKAFIDGLPASTVASLPHEVGFPFNIRRSLGGWKFLFLSSDWALAGDLTPTETRGRYLAEALAHCGECHTPRNVLGGLERGRWLAGGPNPTGDGRIPNITPAKLTWSDGEILEYFTTGFTPEFDSAGGHMAKVVRNLARLPKTDREAIVAYLKRVPPAE